MLILDENNLPTNSVLYLASVASAQLQKSGPQFISELLLLTEKETGLQINSIFFFDGDKFPFSYWNDRWRRGWTNKCFWTNFGCAMLRRTRSFVL